MAAKQSPEPEQRTDASLPLKGYVRLYEVHLRAEQKTAKTIEIYQYVLTRFLAWYETTHGVAPTLDQFTGDQVRFFLVDAQDKPRWDGHPYIKRNGSDRISSATLHLYVRTLKTFGAWLAREGSAPVNPLETVRVPKIEQKQLVPLTEEEERQLIDSYDDNNPADCRIKAMFLLMLDTGLRLSEVTHLKDSNVDLDNGFLLVMGKGRKERSVPFGFTAEKVLRKYVTFFRPDPATPRIDEFFISPDGYPMTDRALEMVFVRARSRTGIQRLHAHLLRHTYGIRAQEQDMPTITLQHYMGHSSSKVTERYVHAAQSEKLKRARGFSPVDQLRIRIRPSGRRKQASPSSRRPV
jgi:site-specific recombinase XerD